LSGCNVVVNCSRGSDVTMLKGLKNIIKASQKNKIEKFIHIGSIAIYGNNPPPGSSKETATPAPGANSYGVMKLKQDEMVLKLHASGIPSIILCPSNISGPYSPFVFGAALKLLSNEIILVDDGKYPTNLIHVDNLVEAILTAIESDKGLGERYFINEVEQTTWKEFYEELKEILGVKRELVSIPRDEVTRELEKSAKDINFMDNLRVLKSREFRTAMSIFPAFKKLDDFVCNIFFSQKPEIQDKLRLKLMGPVIIAKETKRINANDPYIRVQIRQVYHSPEKMISKINYSPFLYSQQRKETTASWFRFINLSNNCQYA